MSTLRSVEPNKAQAAASPHTEGQTSDRRTINFTVGERATVEIAEQICSGARSKNSRRRRRRRPHRPLVLDHSGEPQKDSNQKSGRNLDGYKNFYGDEENGDDGKGKDEQRGHTQSLQLQLHHRHHRKNGWLQVLAVTLYIVTWVANAEFLQAITDGRNEDMDSIREVPSSTSATIMTNSEREEEPDDIMDDTSFWTHQPATITWFSYNYMMLSAVFVVFPYVHWKFHRIVGNDVNRKCTSSSQHVSSTLSSFISSLKYYICHVWAGKQLGLPRAMIYCTIIAYALQLLNTANILGLQCISVSRSNAIFQLQTAFTVGLSSFVNKYNKHGNESTCMTDTLGILISTSGVAMIVLPPLIAETNALRAGSAIVSSSTMPSSPSMPSPSFPACFSHSSPTAFGCVMTLLAAAIGGAYLVFWNFLDDARFGQIHLRQHQYKASENNILSIPAQKDVTTDIENQTCTGDVENMLDDNVSNAHDPRDTNNESNSFPNETNNDNNNLATFVDTHMTLAMIGFCNLVAGWPLVLMLDGTTTSGGQSTSFFHLLRLLTATSGPTTTATTTTLLSASKMLQKLWKRRLYLLHCNGLIEYSFDASCASAIYMTSPIVTAVVAPLTIPVSMIADEYLSFQSTTSDTTTPSTSNSSPSSLPLSSWVIWLGVIMILIGIIVLETKPKQIESFFFRRAHFKKYIIFK